MRDSNQPEFVEDIEFDEWAKEKAREYEELKQDRFACGGQNCTGAHVPTEL